MAHNVATVVAPGRQPDRAATAEPFNRPPRIVHRLPDDEVEIPAPPPPPNPPITPQLTAMLLPLVTASFYVIILLIRPEARINPWVSLPSIGIAVISVGVGLLTYRRHRRAQQAARVQYDDLCQAVYSGIQARLADLDYRQRAQRNENDPEPGALVRIAGVAEGGDTPPRQRLWERRPEHADFLALRIGRADMPASVKIKQPSANQFASLPLMERATTLAREYSTVRDVPLAVRLREVGSLGIAGERPAALALVRAMLAQLIVHHAPGDVRVIGVWSDERSRDWDWMLWMPHTCALTGDDTYRLLARYDGPTEHLQHLIGILARELQQRNEASAEESRPRLVLILDDYDRFGRDYGIFADAMRRGRVCGIHALCIVPQADQVPGECGGYIDLADPQPVLAVAGLIGSVIRCAVDAIDIQTSNRLARRLAKIVLADATGRRDLPRQVRLTDLLNIADIRAYQPDLLWNIDPNKSWHPVPVGLVDAAHPLIINLNEGAHGAHGMIAGTTGSGKSQLLLTFLMALAVRHSPDRLNLMLIDFKGGATFRDLADLPHTVGVVTDLHGYMTERALLAINSELDRRKSALAACRVADIHEYRAKASANGANLAPIPNLMIVIDEFDEMARDYPDLVLEFVRVAKQGRSLGVHMLFATQQPASIKEGMLLNLAYNIALRVTSPNDSRAVVGLPDAAYLATDTPGRGIFRAGTQAHMFQSALVTLPYHAAADQVSQWTMDVTGRIEELNHTLANLLSNATSPDANQSELTLLKLAMQRSHGSTYAASHYRIWLPPLCEVSLGDLLQQHQRESGAVFGLCDLPTSAEQTPLVFRLAESGGHMLVLGSAGSGKTTLLRTLLLAFALRHAPSNLWIYTIDPSGGACGLYGGARQAGETRLPHLADVFATGDVARIERLLVELQTQIDRRRQLFRDYAVDTLAAYVAQRVARPDAPEPPQHLLVAIDNFAELAASAPDAVETLRALLRDSRKYGVTFLITGSAARDVASGIQNHCETRIALRLNDPADSDSLIGKSFAARIRADQPGRGFLRATERPVEIQIALPSLRPASSNPDNSSGSVIVAPGNDETEEAVRKISAKYGQAGGRRPQPLRELPPFVAPSDLMPVETSTTQLPVGLADVSFQPIVLDFAGNTPHLLIAGGQRCGKSSLLGTIIAGLAVRNTPDEAQFLLVDYRRRKLQMVEQLPHVREMGLQVGTGTSAKVLEQVRMVRLDSQLRALAEALQRELGERVRGNGPWPRLFLVICGWDHLGSIPQELENLAPFASQGQDIGFHLLISGSEFSNAGSSRLLRAVRGERAAVFLGRPPEQSQAATSIGMKLPRQMGHLSMPLGRGYIQIQDSLLLVQFVAPAGIAPR